MATPPVALAPDHTNAWKSKFYEFWVDPMTCLFGYCCPCVMYSMNAEEVHGGAWPEHCAWFCLSSCICMCGVKTGPTRAAIRKKYGLKNEILDGATNPLFPDAPWGEDCLLGTIPCLNLLTMCQDYREVKMRGGLTEPIDPRPANFIEDLKHIGGNKGAAAPAAKPAEETAAAPPAEQEMAKS